MNNEEKYNSALEFLNKYDGLRYEAVKYFISKMSVSDLKLITDFCIETERAKRN